MRSKRRTPPPSAHPQTVDAADAREAVLDGEAPATRGRGGLRLEYKDLIASLALVISLASASFSGATYIGNFVPRLEVVVAPAQWNFLEGNERFTLTLTVVNSGNRQAAITDLRIAPFRHDSHGGWLAARQIGVADSLPVVLKPGDIKLFHIDSDPVDLLYSLATPVEDQYGKRHPEVRLSELRALPIGGMFELVGADGSVRRSDVMFLQVNYREEGPVSIGPLRGSPSVINVIPESRSLVWVPRE